MSKTTKPLRQRTRIWTQIQVFQLPAELFANPPLPTETFLRSLPPPTSWNSNPPQHIHTGILLTPFRTHGYFKSFIFHEKNSSFSIYQAPPLVSLERNIRVYTQYFFSQTGCNRWGNIGVHHVSWNVLWNLYNLWKYIVAVTVSTAFLTLSILVRKKQVLNKPTVPGILGFGVWVCFLSPSPWKCLLGKWELRLGWWLPLAALQTWHHSEFP